MITTVKMDLFDAPKGSILAHAENATGVPSKGLAKAIQQRFPGTYLVYKHWCQSHSPRSLVGTTLLVQTPDYTIANMFTSAGYGTLKDSERDILRATGMAVKHLITAVDPSIPIYSNKFNSGLFRVPWERSYAMLEWALKDTDFNWIVCDID